jgi:hypothetical protein
VKPPPLRLGELFPADDVAGQWVFSLSALVNDLHVITRRLRAVEQGDLKELLCFYRQLVTRLYEAGRLVVAIDKQPEIAAFVGEQPLATLASLRDGANVA